MMPVWLIVLIIVSGVCGLILALCLAAIAADADRRIAEMSRED